MLSPTKQAGLSAQTQTICAAALSQVQPNCAAALNQIRPSCVGALGQIQPTCAEAPIQKLLLQEHLTNLDSSVQKQNQI